MGCWEELHLRWYHWDHQRGSWFHLQHRRLIMYPRWGNNWTNSISISILPDNLVNSGSWGARTVEESWKERMRSSNYWEYNYAHTLVPQSHPRIAQHIFWAAPDNLSHNIFCHSSPSIEHQKDTSTSPLDPNTSDAVVLQNSIIINMSIIILLRISIK
jgi:hypothetical protein